MHRILGMLRWRHVAIICRLSLFLAMSVSRQRLRTHHVVVCGSWRLCRDFITMLLLSWVGLSWWRKLVVTPRILLLIIIIDCTIFSLLLLLVYEALINCLPTTPYYYITWSMSLLFAASAWSPTLSIHLQGTTRDFFIVRLGRARSLDLLRLGWTRSSFFGGDVVGGVARNRICAIMLLSMVRRSTLLMMDTFFDNTRARYRNSLLLHGFTCRQMTVWIWIYVRRSTLLLISIYENTLGCLDWSAVKSGHLTAIRNVLVATLSILRRQICFLILAWVAFDHCSGTLVRSLMHRAFCGGACGAVATRSTTFSLVKGRVVRERNRIVFPKSHRFRLILPQKTFFRGLFVRNLLRVRSLKSSLFRLYLLNER